MLILLASLSACTPVSGPKPAPPQAVDGVLDLRGWDFAADGPIRLAGEWEFYWRSLPTSQDFVGPSLPTESSLIPVPGAWNGVAADGQPVGATGYATYRLRVLINLDAIDEALAAIHMPPPINTAHVLYVNGERVGGAGQVGVSLEESRAEYAPYIAPFPHPSEQIEILIHISNYLHATGGLTEAPLFGPYSQVLEQLQRQAGRNLFLLGAIFVMGIYHLTLFSLRRRERTYLYFGLFCLAVTAVIAILLHPVDFARIVSPAWQALPRTGLFLSAIVALLLLAFTHALFPGESTYGWRVVVASPAVLSLTLAYTIPIQRLSGLLAPFAVYIFTATLFTLGVVLRAVYRRRAGARIVLLGYLPLLGTIVNDGFFFAGQWQSESLVAVGLTLYVFAQAFLLSVRFAQAFTQAEVLSTELGRNNASLRQAQQELAQSEAEYRAIFEESRDLIVTLAADGTIQAANPASQELLGYNPAEMSFADPGAFFAHAEECQRLLDAVALSGTVSNFAAELRHRDGRLIPCIISVSQRQSSGDEAPGYQAIVHDVSDLRRAEAERERARQMQQEKVAAEAASQAKSHFLATMTHELRTPLNSILGYAQLLQKQPQLNPVQSRGVTTILSSGRHLLHLIEDVLDLARIEANRLEIVSSEVDLAGLLTHVVDAVRVEAEQKGLRLSGRFSPHLPPHIVTDAKRLRQILLNLLSNAIRYTRHGEVALSVSALPDVTDEAKSWLRFEVTDTGLGLTPEEMARIFAPFEQATPAGKASQGLGLGLSISQRLAERLGGSIQVESTPGVGSRFWFDIPCVCPQEPGPMEAERRASSAQALPVLDAAALGLTAEAIQPLDRLARIGDIKGVEAEAKRLAAVTPTAQPFVDQVLVLAQGFNDQAIRTLIKRLSEPTGRGR